MKRTLFTGVIVVALISATSASAIAQNNEPLMQGSSNVTPADETPMPAVDRLSEDVSPAAYANTTATDQAGDAGTIPLPLPPEPVPLSTQKKER